MADITERIGSLEPRDKIFLAFVVAFHDAQGGARLLQQIGVRCLADCHCLNFQQRTVIAGLFLNQVGGW